MALVIIIIHCLLVLLSSACFLSSCFVVPPHVRATWHAYQLSLGCSESTGSGGRRLVNSPGAVERSRRPTQKLKCTRWHKTKNKVLVQLTEPIKGCQHSTVLSAKLPGALDVFDGAVCLSDTCIKKQGGGRRL